MIWHLFFEIWAKVKKLSEIKPPWGKSLMQFSFISATKELLLTGNLSLVINNINFLSFYHSKVPNPTFLFLNNHTTHKKRSWFQVREIRYYFVAFCERLCPHLINIVQKTQSGNHTTQRSVISIKKYHPKRNSSEHFRIFN